VTFVFEAPLVSDPGDQAANVTPRRLDGSQVFYRIAEVKRPGATDLLFDFSLDAPTPAFGTLTCTGAGTGGSTDPQAVRSLGGNLFGADYFPPDFVAEPLQVTIAFFGRTPVVAGNARLVGDDEFLLGTGVIELRPPDRPLTVSLAVAPHESIVVPSDPTHEGTVNATPSTTLTATLIGGSPDLDLPGEFYAINWLVNDQPGNPDVVTPTGVLFTDTDGDGVPDTFTSTMLVNADTSIIGAPLFRAIVTDGEGNTATTALSITVAAPLTIVLNSNPARPRGGDTVDVSAGVGGGLPPYTYAWSNSFGRPFLNQAIIDSGTATSAALRLPDDAATFDVAATVTDQRGNSVRQSLAAQVGEEGGVGTRCNPGDEPAILVEPAEIGAGTDPAVFSVTTQAGIDGGLFSVTWERNVGNGFETVRSTGDGRIVVNVPPADTTDETRTLTATLTIDEVLPEDQGEPSLYRAVISNDCASTVTLAARLDRTGPLVTLTPDNLGPVNQDATVSFTVTFNEDVTGFSAAGVQIVHDSGGTTADGTIGAITALDARNYIVPVTGVTGDGHYSLRARVGAGTDRLGNASQLSDSDLVEVNNTGAQVIGITSTTPDGVYGVSSAVNITVQFSQPVTLLSGTLNVRLDTNYVVQIFPFALNDIASGTYVVQAGDASADLESINIELLGTLRDAAGNNVLVIMPDVANRLAANKAIVINTATPSITNGAIAADNTYIDVTTSLGVYTNFNGTGALVPADFTLTFDQNGGNATNVTINSLTRNTGAPLTGGETVIRVVLDITGVPSGVERVTITPAGANTIFDASGNPMPAGATTGDITLNDQLAPTVTGVSVFDELNIDVTFSETMGAGVTTAANYTVSGTGQGTLSNNPDSVTHQGGTVYRLTWLAPEEMLDGGTITITVANVEDAAGLAIDPGGNSGTHVGGAIGTLPTIDNGAVAANNAYVDVTISEAVYANNNGTGALVVADFTLTFDQNGGNATNVTINSLTNNADGALAGGETVIRVVLDVTGVPDGQETVTITPADGNSIFDVVGNPMDAAETTGALNLNDELPPVIEGGTVPADNAYVDVTMSEAVYANNDGTGALQAADFTLTFDQNGGNATNVTINSLTNNADGALVGGETVIRVVLDVTGVPDGLETVTITPADGNSIFDAAGNAMAAGQTTGAVTLSDQLPPVIDLGVMEATNAHVDVTISEGVYANNDGTGALQVADFTLTFDQNGGSATNVTINSLTNNADGALAGGETVIRVVLDVTGVPDGNELVTITPADGNSIFDAAGNAMDAAETTGALNLNP